MTKDEFRKKYHCYQTCDKATAYRDAAKVNEEGVDGATVVPINFGDLGWCLMLDTAAAALIKMFVLGPENR